MPNFKSVLYLDDMRVPTIVGITLVRNYDEFIRYINHNGIPDLISFDHDLAAEHYPTGENGPEDNIDYSSYKERTGLDCTRYIVQNELPLNYWAVHSFNVRGKMNIEAELRKYCPDREVKGLKIPFKVL
jgi:hypothetical protein